MYVNDDMIRIIVKKYVKWCNYIHPIYPITCIFIYHIIPSSLPYINITTCVRLGVSRKSRQISILYGLSRGDPHE